MSTPLSTRHRIRAVLFKEVIQMRRDRLTFAMIVGIPIMQLVLFGYAINTDPKHLPTGVVDRRSGPVARAIVAGMQTSGYFRIDGLLTRGGGARRVSRTARSPSSSPCRATSTSDLVRGRNARDRDRGRRFRSRPPPPTPSPRCRRSCDRAIAASADGPPAPASRSAAPRSSSTASTIRRHQHLQHRAGPDRHDPHHDDDADDGAGADPRDRARHHGEPSRHAAPAARHHDRQDRALYRPRLPAGRRHPRRRLHCSSRCRWKAR